LRRPRESQKERGTEKNKEKEMEQGKEWEILKREKEGETDSSLLLINEEMMMNFTTGHDMPQYDLHRIAGWPIV
jgi:hypothetical protein